jgi:pSer/pThr/pTyr-binding forkhead associated (FHA) protein
MPQIPIINIQLVHIQGPLKGQIQDFSQFPVHIGRHSSCQVRFDKHLTTISRRHARIERQGNRFRIIDFSTNGTFVNGKRIADVYLRDGDVITFAENGQSQLPDQNRKRKGSRPAGSGGNRSHRRRTTAAATGARSRPEFPAGGTAGIRAEFSCP